MLPLIRGVGGAGLKLCDPLELIRSVHGSTLGLSTWWGWISSTPFSIADYVCLFRAALAAQILTLCHFNEVLENSDKRIASREFLNWLNTLGGEEIFYMVVTGDIICWSKLKQMFIHKVQPFQYWARKWLLAIKKSFCTSCSVRLRLLLVLMVQIYDVWTFKFVHCAALDHTG